MYLILGPNRAVREENIVGVFDTDNATVSKITREFLKEAEQRGQLENSATDLPRSFVLVRQKTEDRVIFCASTTGTLRKRGNITGKE